MGIIATAGVRILNHTVGQWYAEFPQTSDDEVCRLLAAAWIR